MFFHRHLNTCEDFIILRGKLKVLFYNDYQKLENSFTLDPRLGNYGIEIPMGQWHSIEVLEKGTVIFEVKDGPYRPITDKDILKKEYSLLYQSNNTLK